MLLLRLPRLEISMRYPDDTVLFILGGRRPDAEWLKTLSFQTEVWAVDSGADVCQEAGIVPERLIGDLDSAKNWEQLKNKGTKISLFDADKDLTDFQLALKIFAEERNGGGIFLTGCMGGRFDHLWSIVHSFAGPACKHMPIGMADEREGMIFLQGGSKAALNFESKPKAISLFSITKKCQGVSVNGTKWPLKNAALLLEEPYAVSNRFEEGSTAEVEVKNGLLAVYWIWREDKICL